MCYGHFEWQVLSFRLTNAPAMFMTLMNHLFNHLLDICVVIFLDDILVFSRNLDDHDKHLNQVFQILQANKLYANPKKCSFYQSSVEFLGHIVSGQGVTASPKKIETLKAWPAPTNVKELSSFLGLGNFLRKFIAGYAEITRPLTDLTRKDLPYKWTPECETAFQSLKDAFCSLPVLILPDPLKPYHLFSDMSNYAIRACLMQDHGKGFQPIAYESHKLHGAELNYTICDKELLAIIYALKSWHHLILSPHVSIYTDHQSLTCLNDHKSEPPPMSHESHWLDFLAEYHCDILYHPGRTTVVADALLHYLLSLSAITTVLPDSCLLADVHTSLLEDSALVSIVKALTPSPDESPVVSCDLLNQQHFLAHYMLENGLLYFQG